LIREVDALAVAYRIGFDRALSRAQGGPRDARRGGVNRAVGAFRRMRRIINMHSDDLPKIRRIQSSTLSMDHGDRIRWMIPQAALDSGDSPPSGRLAGFPWITEGGGPVRPGGGAQSFRLNGSAGKSRSMMDRARPGSMDGAAEIGA
jgi:hypothetical protein